MAGDAGPKAGGDHWSELARRWELSGPPLRVSPEDGRAYWDTVAALAHGAVPPRVLILGVTPELYALPWPDGTSLEAADLSSAMIEMVWPGPRSAVRQEDWTTLSFEDTSRNVALCDGGFHLLDHVAGQARLVRSLRRVLAPGGIFVVRLFVPPETHESPEQVLHQLREGRIGNVNQLKLRLDMALQRGPDKGVQLAEVWDVFHAAEPDADDLATRIGWRVDEVRSVEAYRDSPASYHFVTVDEVRDLFCRDGGFQLESFRVPGYELGERCPMVALRRTGV